MTHFLASIFEQETSTRLKVKLDLIMSNLLKGGEKSGMENRLWLSVDEAAPLIGEKPDAIYRDIREGQFPFEFVRCGKRIKISARSIGLIPPAENRGEEPRTASAETA